MSAAPMPHVAPQVSMVMSPDGDVENDFFIVTLNHWSYPDFAAGGMQVQRWNSEIATRSHKVKTGHCSPVIKK